MPILAITRLAVLAATLASTAGAPESDSPSDRLAAAARSGDAAEVRRLLDDGLSVDTPLRYNTTALHPACDRGHVEVVKLLLTRGAKTEVTDSFYGSTPLVWALSPAMGPFTDRHLDIVRLLLAKGAKGREWVLSTGASRSDAGLVRAALEEGMPGPYDLALALAQAKGDEVAALLKAAGAKPLPEASFVVEPAQLEAYAGEYAGEARRGIRRLRLEVDGKHLVLRADSAEVAAPLGALDARTFWTSGPPFSALVTLDVTGPEVRGLTLRASGGPARYLARVRPEETP
jgi:hypothetical protein